MVRLFMHQGAGLHPAILEREEPQTANQLSLLVPALSTYVAGALTLGRKLLRRPLLSMPTVSAYFLTRVGFIAIATSPLVAYLASQERRIHTSVLRYEGITPPKYRFWKSSQGFTADDAVLVGGIGGLLVSLRLRGFMSLSMGHRLLGRLGAFSAGTMTFPFLGIMVDRQKPSMQRSLYERAVALRKLNDDPKFNQSLAPDFKLAELIWSRTVYAQKEAMSLACLTEEEKAVLRPTMVFSWLDTLSCDTIFRSPKDSLSVDWKYSEDASSAEKRDHVLKELQFVAAMLKPYTHNMSCALQHKPISRHETFNHEWITLIMVLIHMMSGLLATEGQPQTKANMHYCLSVIDADKGEDHVPMETLDCLYRLKMRYQEQGKPPMVAGIENLIRDFEKRATKNE